ncbi:MAG: cyclic-di-AMP receptor [Chloroflexi bacterium]|nr:cyclic-di-AMP receptor [Chloroflexota bacterium]
MLLFDSRAALSMKLITTIVQAYDSDRLLRAVTTAGFGATKINSVGGFLRMANSTILMAVDQDKVADATAIIRSIARRRVEVKVDATTAEYDDVFAAGVHEVEVGGAVVFVMPLEAIYKIYPDTIERYDKTPVRN